MTDTRLIKPIKLFKGARLGIIAPSYPISAQEKYIERGYQRLKEMGFALVEAPQCRLRQGHSAGTIKQRVQAIHHFFSDKSVHAIMAFWGGYQSHQLLEYLDYELIVKNPKVLIGYSDITALSLGIYSKTGLIGFSGPCVISFAKTDIPKYTLNSFSAVTFGLENPIVYNASSEYSDNRWWEQDHMVWEPTPSWKVFRKGKIEGHLVGGNIGTMLLLAGTQYWPKLEGAILFVEDDEAEKPQTINRMFTHLRQMGVWSQIKGLIVGRFPRCIGFSETDSLEMILEESLKGFNFPVLYDVDYGHTDPLLTFPIGVKAQLDADRREITLCEKAVS